MSDYNSETLVFVLVIAAMVSSQGYLVSSISSISPDRRGFYTSAFFSNQSNFFLV